LGPGRTGSSLSHPSGLNQFRKFFKTPVPGTFHIVRKEAGRKLTLIDVIGKTFATSTFARAPVTAAVAAFEIRFQVALDGHIHFPQSDIARSRGWLKNKEGRAPFLDLVQRFILSE
jgi:hypothetical protein